MACLRCFVLVKKSLCSEAITYVSGFTNDDDAAGLDIDSSQVSMPRTVVPTLRKMVPPIQQLPGAARGGVGPHEHPLPVHVGMLPRSISSGHHSCGTFMNEAAFSTSFPLSFLVVAEEHLAVPHEAPLGPGRGGTRMWSRSRPAGTRWRGGARRRARGLREAGPGAPAPAARRPLAPLPVSEPAPGRPGPSERPGAAEGLRLAWPPAALPAAPGRASPGPPRSRPGESEVCWRPSL